MTNNTIPNVPRYRVEKTGRGFWPYCVRAGDGTREVFVGHQKQCAVVAAELETAFEDGKFVSCIAPSPAGVDGCQHSHSAAPRQPEGETFIGEPLIAKFVVVSRESLQALFRAAGCSGAVENSEVVNAGVRAIDGLRGEVDQLQSMLATVSKAGIRVRTERDQQAQRIGELERALLEVAASLAWNAHGECRAIHDGPIMPSKMAIDVAKAALSAGKEGE